MRYTHREKKLFMDWHRKKYGLKSFEQILMEHPELDDKWDMAELSRHPDISIDFIRKNFDRFSWDREMMAQNPNLLWEKDKSNVTLDEYSLNSNFTPELLELDMKENGDYYYEEDLYYPTSYYSSNLNFTWKYISEQKTEIQEFSCNPNITPKIVRENPHIDWDYQLMSRNPSINWQLVRDNLKKGWDFFYLSLNPGITWKDIHENPDAGWIPEAVSMNPNITWKIVSHYKYDWDYNNLSSNPGILWSDIKEYRDVFLYDKYIGENPNLTWEDIFSETDVNWDWEYISANNFMYDDTVFSRIYKKEMCDFLNSLIGKKNGLCDGVNQAIVEFL